MRSFPDEVLKIIKKFNEANYQIYIVGGAVRDLLLEREIKDWDFATDASPEEILKLFQHGFNNNQFGTVGIPTEDGSILEITTMRKESEYLDNRHPEKVEWTDKIEEDLARRDFTINAMALDGNSLEIIDPFSGKKDLESKVIRAVGDANKRFNEDALRLMRAVRFATQLGFSIDDETFSAIKENALLIKNISNERIRDELLKILASNYPYEGIMLLRSSGLFQVILPEVEHCFGILQEGPKHDRTYDIGQHSLLSLKYCASKDPVTRLATLLHDIGKVKTYKKDKDGNVTFYGHEIVGAKIAKEIAIRLRLSNKEIEKVVNLVRWHMFTVDEKQTDSAVRRFIKNVGLENIDEMMALRVGDRLGGGTEKEISWRMKIFRERIDQVLQKPFSISDLKITGTDVMEVLNIKPGKKVGEVLQKLFEEVQEDDSKNNREYLLNRISKLNS